MLHQIGVMQPDSYAFEIYYKNDLEWYMNMVFRFAFISACGTWD